MDWIERLFHLAPDGGSGSLEVGLIAGIAVAIALVIASAIKLSAAVRRWFGLLAPQRRTGADPLTRGEG